MSHFSGEQGKCHSFEVIGGFTSISGTYELSDKRADDAPNNLVWKKPTEDRFIFNTGSSTGWRIGKEDALKSGSYWYQSKKFLK